MSESEKPQKRGMLLAEILDFVDKSSGLRAHVGENGKVSIFQRVDGKGLYFFVDNLFEVLHRTDSDGRLFIQVNFANGNKVLFTNALVGFKPSEIHGLDMAKIPRVVTTPDLVSVFVAIEEGLASEEVSGEELDVLRRVYAAIIHGGEMVGFDLQLERRWLNRLMLSKTGISV